MKFALTIGLHLLFLASVFDIYFRSPIISSGDQFSPSYQNEAPAKRIVLFVADGLRAESIYGYADRTPYLKRVANDLGVWGVSHTKLPTESRPGHVALIAGMFEDPSAITKGWQENPVDFDTVFNQSKHVWSWGSPDILPMFAKGAWNGQVAADTYAPQLEKFFANQDISQLDTWVFDRVKRFLADQAENETLKRSNQVILFLHLLGLDTNGHSNKPNSPEFLRNLAIVDRGVQEMVRLCEDFWKHDGRTSYIFTADHGMTDWGSHGAGMDHETQTPFLAWGAGIRSPIEGQSGWTLFAPHRKSTNINQTDAAPFMSALLGNNMPQNSVGKVPIDMLAMHSGDKIEALLANALQVHWQYLAMKERMTKTWMPRLFSRPDPFPMVLKDTLDKITAFKNKAKYDFSLSLVKDLYEHSLHALFHYQRYHRLPLYIATSFTYIGFIIFVILNLLKDYSSVFIVSEKTRPVSALLVFGVIYSLFVTVGHNVPYHYCLYYFSPFLIWSQVLQLVMLLRLAPNQQKQCLQLLKIMALSLVIIECLIISFFERRAISLVLIILMAVYFRHLPSNSTKALWTILCLSLAAFSFQPSIGKERNPNLVVLNAIIATILSSAILYKLQIRHWTHKLLLSYLILSGLCVTLANKNGDSQAVKIASWTILTTALPLGLMGDNRLLQRLFGLNMALMSIYQLFSLTYESLFLNCLSMTMFFWLQIEHKKRYAIVNLLEVRVVDSARQRNMIDGDDFLRAVVFLTFAIVSFFGTGNIASLNSFDPRSIQTLVATFSPFLMGGLLLLKVVLPFFAVALFAFSVQFVTQMPRTALFWMVLIFSDIMGLQFFFMVTDQGSWLDIGTSLSHFVIIEATVIFLQILFHFASFAMKWRLELYKTK